VDSPRREVTLAKRILRKLMRWYLRYLSEQTTALGQATLRVGHILAERADSLEDTTAGLVSELAGLAERVERLERLVGEGAGNAERGNAQAAVAGEDRTAPGSSPGSGGDRR
jgi:hypothetical protein